MQRWFGALVAVLALMLGSSATLRAQGLTTGAVGGIVTDSSGRPIEGAQVQIRNEATGFSAGALTRANGRYTVQGLAVGTYTITVRNIGYAPVNRANERVVLGQTTIVDVVLTQATATLQGITITADASGADFTPSRQGAATVINDTLIRRVPLLQRDFTDLTKLSPQVARPQAGGGPSAGGVYNRFNNYTVDGVNQNDRFNLSGSGGTPGGSTGGRIMSVEAVKEFQVLLSPTDVRYGNFAGMLVNAVTKSGTNTWEGGATYTFRTPGMAADTAFIRNADFNVRQYGFSLGGPIIKDKLHFFVAPEWQARTDPSSGPAADLSTGQIGDVRLDSIARIAQIMSARGVDVGTTGLGRRGNPLANLFGRLDWQINGNNRFAFRQLYNTAEQDEFSRNVNNFNTNVGQQNSGIRLTSNAFSRKNTNISSVFSLYTTGLSGWSNELSVGYNTVEDERLVPVNTPEISVAVTPVGGTNPNRPVTFGTERFSPGNLLEQDMLEISNNFTKTFGDHTVTMGGRFEQTYIYNYFLSGAANGAYIFPSIARLAAGTPSGYAFSYANGGDIQAEFSGQPDHGLRAGPLERVAQLRRDVRSFAWTCRRYLDSPVLNQDILTRSTAAGTPVRTDWTPKTQALWSPRVGFNWNVGGESRTQLRGNIGVFTAPVPYIMVGQCLLQHRSRRRDGDVHRGAEQRAGVHHRRVAAADRLCGHQPAGAGRRGHGGHQHRGSELQEPAEPHRFARLRPHAAGRFRVHVRRPVPQGDQRHVRGGPELPRAARGRRAAVHHQHRPRAVRRHDHHQRHRLGDGEQQQPPPHPADRHEQRELRRGHRAPHQPVGRLQLHVDRSAPEVALPARSKVTAAYTFMQSQGRAVAHVRPRDLQPAQRQPDRRHHQRQDDHRHVVLRASAPRAAVRHLHGAVDRRPRRTSRSTGKGCRARRSRTRSTPT